MLIQQEHFDWMASEERPPAMAADIRTALEGTWERVRTGLGDDGKRLGRIDSGKLDKASTEAWAQTTGEIGPSDVNLTLELRPDEFSLNVVGWFDEQFEKLRSWLSRLEARKLLATTPEYSLILFARQGVGSADRGIVWQGARGEERKRYSLAETAPIHLPTRLTTFVSGLDSPREKPAAHLRRGWSAHETIGNDDLVDLLIVETKRWLPILGQMNVREY